jgi:cytochrome P450
VTVVHSARDRITVEELGQPSLPELGDREPWDFYEAIRQAGGIAWDEQLGAWLVSSFDLMKEIGRADNKLWLTQDLFGEAPGGMTREDWRAFVGYGSIKTLHTVDAGSRRHQPDHVEERRDGAGNDLVSLLWREASELYAGAYDETDIIAASNVVFSCGTTTTAATTGNALYLLMIALSIAAGRDGSHYARQNDVDLDRSTPRDHLGFQYGKRACPGQGLARTQLGTALSVVLVRMSELTLDPAAEPPRYSESFLRCWRPLHAHYSVDR